MKALKCPFLTRIPTNHLRQYAPAVLSYAENCPIMGHVIKYASMATKAGAPPSESANLNKCPYLKNESKRNQSTSVAAAEVSQGKQGGHLYKNSWDCMRKTLRSEGILGLYKGFFPNWMRIGPHTIVTFFIFEQLRKAIGMAPV